MNRNYKYDVPSGPASVIKKFAEEKQYVVNQNISKYAAAQANDKMDGVGSKSGKASQKKKEKTAARASDGDKTDRSKTINLDLNLGNSNSKRTTASPEVEFTQQRLQDAIIWSEIIGKPVSRRRRIRE